MMNKLTSSDVMEWMAYYQIIDKEESDAIAQAKAKAYVEYSMEKKRER